MPNRKNDTFSEFTDAVNKATSAIKACLRQRFREQGIDLTFEMVQVLRCLWNKDGVKQQELACLTLKDKASLTLLIDNLAKRNLVQRTEDPTDRRNKLITLKPEGQRLKHVIQPLIDEIQTLAGRDVSQEWLKNGTALFEKMCANLKTAGV
jgi:DNA-binding MarR family transcriptional regulator